LCHCLALHVALPSLLSSFFLFFFNDTATTEIYTLSLHDALPISRAMTSCIASSSVMTSATQAAAISPKLWPITASGTMPQDFIRSEEHTSELQSLTNLVCRLLLEKKKRKQHYTTQPHTCL